MMRDALGSGTFNRKTVALAAAAAISAFFAAPLVMSASRALATSEEPAAVSETVAVVSVEVGALRAAPAAEPCRRKVRVVYGGYGTPADGCAAR